MASPNLSWKENGGGGVSYSPTKSLRKKRRLENTHIRVRLSHADDI